VTTDEDDAEEIRQAIREAMLACGARKPRRKKATTDDKKPDEAEP
jgi:hypothetical protein